MTSSICQASELVFKASRKSLMAHSIRGLQAHFFRHGVLLDVIVARDYGVFIAQRAPGKASILVTKQLGRGHGNYFRLEARIYVRRDANHHLTRLCIAHELYHLYLTLEDFGKNGRTCWDGERPHDEVACNQFAKELCRKHNEFNKNPSECKDAILFPDEIFADEFILDLGDLGSLPECLKIPQQTEE